MISLQLQSLGIQLAMSLQRSIVRVAAALIESRTIRHCQAYRFVILADSGPAAISPADARIFQYPGPLEQLALFLSDALREFNKETKPFIIANAAHFTDENISPQSGNANDDDGGVCLVLGVAEDPRHRNKLGLAFQRCAEQTGSRVRHDRFDSSIIEVRREDFPDFMENLKMYS